MVNLFDSEDERQRFLDMVARFPESVYKRWFKKLYDYTEFLLRCYQDTKEENEHLRTLNADLTLQLAEANVKNSNLSPQR